MQHTVFQVGEWRVEPALGRVRRGDQSVTLQRKTMALLEFLAAHPGEVLSTDELMAEVWGDTVVSENVVYWNINQLRAVLETGQAKQSYIKTIPRRGYRLIAKVGQAGSPQGRPAFPVRTLAAAATVFTLIVAGWLWRADPTPQVAPGPATLAVLPFVNLNSDPEGEAFADGITEELLNALAQMDGLRVTARTSSFYFKGRDIDVREAGRVLGVANVIEGSVRREDDQYRITVQLIDARDGHHRWSQTYDRKTERLLAMQRDVALHVATALALQIDLDAPRWGQGSQQQAAAARWVAEADALGRTQQSPEELLDVVRLLNEALAEDPANLPALSRLCRTHIHLITIYSYDFLGNVHAIRRVLDRMRAQGLEDTAGFLFCDGVLTRFDMEMQGTTKERLAHVEQAFTRAIQLAPNDVANYHSFAIHLRRLGDFSGAEPLLEKALALDPLDIGINIQFARVFSATGREEEALRRAEALLKHHPDNPRSWIAVMDVLAPLGQFDEALVRISEVPLSERNTVLMFKIRSTYLAMGDGEEAVSWMRRMQLGDVYDALILGMEGDWDAAFIALDRAIRNTETPMRDAPEWAGDAAWLAGRLDQARFYYQAAARELLEKPNPIINAYTSRVALKLAGVLIETGEQNEAGQLLTALESWIGGHHRLGYEGYATTRAEMLVLQGRSEQAIAELESLFAVGWTQLIGPWTRDWHGQRSPILDKLAGDPRYDALVARSESRLATMRNRVRIHSTDLDGSEHVARR